MRLMLSLMVLLFLLMSCGGSQGIVITSSGGSGHVRGIVDGKPFAVVIGTAVLDVWKDGSTAGNIVCPWAEFEYGGFSYRGVIPKPDISPRCVEELPVLEPPLQASQEAQTAPARASPDPEPSVSDSEDKEERPQE